MKDPTKLTKEQLSNTVAVEAGPVLTTFAMTYQRSPTAVRRYLDGKLAEIMQIDLPLQAQIIRSGYELPVEDRISVAETFGEAIEAAPAEMRKMLSKTVEDAGMQLAELIDKSAKRVLLDDPVAYRGADADLATLHAKLVRALADLQLTAEDREQIAKIESRIAT